MTFAQNLLLTTAVATGVALLAIGPASARTICRTDGICFNTSGAPIAPWQQPAFRGGFADDGYGYGYGYYGYRPYHAYRSYPYYGYHRHWHYEDE
jgi:hypothetical protein